MTLTIQSTTALALCLLVVPSQAVRPALLRIQPVTTAQRQNNHRFTSTTRDFDMINEDAERSLREVLEYHPEMRKLDLLSLSYLPIDLSLSMPIDLSLSMPMTPPPGIDVDDGDSSDDNDVSPIGNGGGSSGGGAGQGGDAGQNTDLVNGIFSTIRSGNAGGSGLGLGKTGQTGLVLFLAIGGLVVMALIVDQKRRAAAATAAASMSGDDSSSVVVAGGAYYDDNSTVSGESIAVGGTPDRFV